MLEQFTVKNYKSIKDEATLDMSATAISEHKDKIFKTKNGQNYLPLCAIYGPNGGGKSNILDAIYMLWRIVNINSGTFKNVDFNKEILNVEPYAFSKENREKPTEFEVFFLENDNEYKYNLHVKKDYIVYEYLSYKRIKGRKEFVLLERENEKIRLDNDFKDLMINDISNNVSLLSLLGYLYKGNKRVKEVINWFGRKLTVINYGKIDGELNYKLVDFTVFNEILLKMFKEMDISIEGIEADKKNDGTYSYRTKHVVDGKDMWLNLNDESSGTIKLVTILPFVAYAISEGITLVIDELDSKLHPLLIGYIIELFSDMKINKKQGQLIFTSHDLTTMDSKYLRRDEIWFVAKGNKQNSVLYSLVEFKNDEGKSVRKDASFSKQYIEGKYGADPYLKRIKEWDING